MRNLKRVLSLALALVMVLGMMVIGTSAATFTDAEEITYTEAVEVMNALGIVKGDNGQFNPDRVLTREEAAKILAYVVLGADVEEYLAGSESPFTDVKADRWSAKYIAFCKNAKYIHGVSETEFNPKGELTVIGFAKLLLGAIGFDTAKYIGGGWADAVAKDMAVVGLDIVEFDTKTLIDRDTACQMALIAMMHGTEKVEYVVYDGTKGDDVADNEMARYDNARDAALDVSLLGGYYVKDTTKVNLLSEVYGVTYKSDKDAFGRPGDSYNWTVGTTPVKMFYADAPVATFEGPVAEKDIFAAAKAPATATQISYTIIQDGVDISDWGKWTADKAIDKVENHAKWTAAGTGYGIKTELYKEGTGAKAVYTLVAVREYLGTVTKVNAATEKTDRNIVVTLDKVPTACETTKAFALETEAFAEKDVVVVTMAGTEIATIAAAESVKGAISKVNGNVYTIGGVEYVQSQNSTAVIPEMDGKEYEYYVDSFGNLIGNKTAPKVETKDEWIYAVVLDAAGVDYVEAKPGSLVAEDKAAQDAKEVIKVKTAADEVLTLDTAWKYELDKDGKWVSTKFVNGGETPTYTKGDLIRYTVNKDGKVAKIEGASSTPAAGKFEKGKANVADWSGILADDTAIFLTDGKKFEVVVGFAKVPTKEFTGAQFFGGSGEKDKAFDAILVTVKSLDEAKKGDDHYVFVAGTDYTAQWDASANKGEGGIVYVYDNLYVDGVKTSLTFNETLSLKKGEMYAYNTETGIVATNLLTGSAKVASVQSSYILADSIVYTGEKTAYVQVDATNGTIAAAEGLPALADYNVTILKVDAKDGVATTIFFSAAKIQK